MALSKSEFEKALVETHLEYVRSIFEQIPDHRPNKFQRSIMDHVAEVSGFAAIQDKGTAFKALGTNLANYRGCFSQARYNPKVPKDCIIMSTDTSDPYWYSVLFHEMAHATGVPKYLDRIGLNGHDKTRADYEFEEIIAETVAGSIMERFGYATDETRKTST